VAPVSYLETGVIHSDDNHHRLSQFRTDRASHPRALTDEGPAER